VIEMPQEPEVVDLAECLVSVGHTSAWTNTIIRGRAPHGANTRCARRIKPVPTWWCSHYQRPFVARAAPSTSMR
jgi:hypothetical protein